VKNVAIWTYLLAPISLGGPKDFSMGAIVAVASKLMKRAKFGTGDSLYHGLELTRTNVLAAFIRGDDAALKNLDDVVKSFLAGFGTPGLIELTRFTLASKIADALTPYNLVQRPSLEAYQAGATFEVGTRAGWVAANAGGGPDKVAALTQEWWERDAAVFTDLKARLNDNSDDEPSPVVAALSGVLDALESGLEALAGVKVPALDVLTPSPTAAQLREWPGIPGQLEPKVQAMGANDWKTYPRVELEVTAGSMSFELADDPLVWRVNQDTDRVELALSVRRLSLTGTKATAHVYIAIEGFIWRLSVRFSLAAEHLHIRNIRVSAALAPDFAPAVGDDAVSVAKVRGLVALKEPVSVDLAIDYEPSEAAKALRSLAQGVDALFLEGDVVPSQAAMERMIEDAIRTAVTTAAERELVRLLDTLLEAIGPEGEGGFKLDLPAPLPVLDQIKWSPKLGARPIMASTAPSHTTFLGAGFLGHQWKSDFEIHTPLTANPFLPNKDAVREADASMVVAVVVDYVEDFIRRILLKLFAAEGFRIQTIEVRLTPPSSASPADNVTLGLNITVTESGGDGFAVAASVSPALADPLVQSLDLASSDKLLQWAESHPEFGGPAERDVFNRLPYGRCIHLGLAPSTDFEVSGTMTRPETEKVKAVLRAVFPLPFAAAPASAMGVVEPWDEVAATKRYLAFRWRRRGPMAIGG
jgi:hypothetical protein